MKAKEGGKIRISLVDYLNAAPLGWSFRHGPQHDRVEVLPSTPARCAEQLAEGEVQVGLIPSIEYQRIPGLKIVPGMAIASRRAVRSVLLLRPRDGASIRSVAVDAGSRTSVALLQLLLEKRMGVRPELVPHPPEPAAMLSRCDAALVIGDAALKLRSEDYRILDLGQAWQDWQDRPFVYAFWACREDSPAAEAIVQALAEAKAYGLARLPEIARAYAKSLAMDEDDLLAYLTDNIDYDLGTPELEGLERFYRLCCEEGITAKNRPLRFLPCA